MGMGIINYSVLYNHRICILLLKGKGYVHILIHIFGEYISLLIMWLLSKSIKVNLGGKKRVLA